MMYEQRCPKCGKLTFYVGDAVPGMLCQCGQNTTADYHFVYGFDPYWLDKERLMYERDEARKLARKLYKQLGDKHIAYISAKAVADYWRERGPKLQSERDEAWRATSRVLKENNELRQLLSEVEFCEGVNGECFWCEGNKWGGHMEYCPRQKALL